MTLRQLAAGAVKYVAAALVSVAFLTHCCAMLAQTPPLPPPPLVEVPFPLTALRFESLPIQLKMAAAEEGRVTVEVTFSAAGEPVAARVISGPEGLRRRALLLALAASFSRELAERKTLPLTFEFFQPPTARSMPPPPPLPFEQAEYAGADYVGLSPELQRRVASVLAMLRAGQRLTDEQWRKIVKDIITFDSRLQVSRHMFSTQESTTGFAVRIRVQAFSLLLPGYIRLAGRDQARRLISRPEPEYPRLARQARIQGTVRFEAQIGKEGTVQGIELLSGHPALVPAAQNALLQHRYQPTLLGGEPVNVVTEVDIDFTLAP